MSAPVRMPKPRRARRSHAERTAETKARIKDAVVEAVAELGIQRVTAAEISRRSGVSWGAAQHHFGDKDGILTAVLVDSFNHLAAGLSNVAVEGRTLEERAGLFVDAAWRHFGSDEYRCTFEILLNMTLGDQSSGHDAIREQTLEVWGELWSRYFGTERLPMRRAIALQHYAVSVLSGLAAMKKIDGARTARRRTELGFLKDTLVRELRRARVSRS